LLNLFVEPVLFAELDWKNLNESAEALSPDLPRKSSSNVSSNTDEPTLSSTGTREIQITALCTVLCRLTNGANLVPANWYLAKIDAMADKLDQTFLMVNLNTNLL
jgi:hypothetical protein